jgi:hypothetical protein
MLNQRVFRLFLSSTFSDFIAEREALQNVVFSMHTNEMGEFFTDIYNKLKELTNHETVSKRFNYLF